MYTAVASRPTAEFHFPVGRPPCEFVGYPESHLNALPDIVLESFAGVRYPFQAQAIAPGQVVLDIGSGSGTDVFIASRLVGSTGRVVAPFVARLTLAVVLAPHGAQHMLGWLGGYGFRGTFAWMTGTLCFPARSRPWQSSWSSSLPSPWSRGRWAGPRRSG
jgi:hypothetical protein